MNIQKINNWFEKRASGIIKYRWLVIILFIGVVAAAGSGLKKLVVESSFDGYFLEDDPMLLKTDEFKEIFGNDNYVAVITECDNSFSKQSLELIRDLSNELMDSISYADKITSLTDIEFMIGNEEGMQIEQIVPDEIPDDKAKLDSIKIKAFSKPNISKKIVSKDGRLTWILLKLRTFPEDSVWKKTSNASPDFTTGSETERIISKEKYKLIAPRAAGMPYMNYTKQTWMGHEASRILLSALVLAIIVLILVTRSVRGVLVPLVTSISSVVILYGTVGHIGYAIDSGMSSIPVIMAFAIAIAYNIHIFSFFRKQMQIHGKRHKAVIDSVSEMGWPILFSALTTTAALLTFLAVPIRPLRFVGVATSACVLVTFLIVITLMPAILSFGKNKRVKDKIIENGGTWFDLKMEKIGLFVINNSKAIIAIAIIISIFCIIGVTKVETAFDVEKTMGRKVPYVDRMLNICESELGSLYSYDLLIELPENGDAKKPENLLKLENLTKHVEKYELTKRTTSILDIIKDLNQTLNENNDRFYAIPDDKNQVAQLLLLYENAGGTEAQYWMDYDYRQLRLMVELSTYNSSEAERELNDVQKQASVLFPGAKVTAVGTLAQFTAMMQYIVRGQIQSFLIALVIIAILLMLVFGSIRIGFIGMIPNIAPALVVGGVMGWMDIPLDMMTATIIPMILGLAVDDTIHFFNHGHLEFMRTRNYKDSITRSFRVIGVAIILSTIVISTNFIVYTSSSALQFFNLGLLAVIGMVSALVADLFITPILLKEFHIFGYEDESTNVKKVKRKILLTDD